MKITVPVQRWDLFRELERSQTLFRVQTADGVWRARVQFTDLSEDGATVVVTAEMVNQVREE